MAPYARVLLQYVQASVAARARVEAFAFGTQLTRITLELAGRDPDRALRRAAERVADWSRRHADRRVARHAQPRARRAGSAAARSSCCSPTAGTAASPRSSRRSSARLRRTAHRLVWLNPLAADPRYEPLTRGYASRDAPPRPAAAGQYDRVVGAARGPDGGRARVTAPRSCSPPARGAASAAPKQLARGRAGGRWSSTRSPRVRRPRPRRRRARRARGGDPRRRGPRPAPRSSVCDGLGGGHGRLAALRPDGGRRQPTRSSSCSPTSRSSRRRVVARVRAAPGDAVARDLRRRARPSRRAARRAARPRRRAARRRAASATC